MNPILSKPPIPFQLVNDSTTDARVGRRIRTATRVVGMATISAMVNLSARVRRLNRRRLRRGEDDPTPPAEADGGGVAEEDPRTGTSDQVPPAHRGGRGAE